MLSRFVDDDFGYLQWLRERPGTFVLDAERTPHRSFVVVHRSACPTISGPTRTGGWTTRMIKVCATTIDEIDSWCTDTVGAHPTPCRECRPTGGEPAGSAEAEAGEAETGEAAPPASARRAPRAAKAGNGARAAKPAPAAASRKRAR